MAAKISTIVLLCTLSIACRGQQAVVAAGADANGSSGSISYSIGQIVYSSSVGGFINEGVQQPYELFITSTEEPFLSIEMNLFPNPTSHELIIEMKNYVDGISADISDIDGRLLERHLLNSKRTVINVSAWSAATYLIRLTDISGKTTSYRLIKH